MSTSLALAGDLMAAGFQRPLVGKVAISSFMSEWGYLLCTKDAVLVASEEPTGPAGQQEDSKRSAPAAPAAAPVVKMCPEVWASHLPEGVTVLDTQALQAFYLIPQYYYKGC